MTKLMPIGVLLCLCFSMPVTMAEECDSNVCFGLDWREATVQDVRDWLQRSGDIHARKGEYSYTPLHFAAKYNDHPEVIKLLLAAGADINAEYKYGGTLLHLAAWYNDNPEVIESLLAAGADINAGAGAGSWTPLHSAVRHNANPEVIKLLLAAGADINAGTSTSGGTPLRSAAEYNDHPEVIKLLLAAGADINAKDIYGQVPLHHAAINNANPEVIKLLLAAGADINAKNKYTGITPLDGANNDKNKSILRKASDYNGTVQQQQLQRELLVLKEDLQAYKRAYKKRRSASEIITVARDGNIRKLRQLLDEGADVKTADLFGVTAFDIARQERNAELLNLLLDYEDKQSGNASLPPPVQVDLNLIKMNNFIDTGDYFSAVVVLERIKSFSEQHGGDLPPSLKFKYAEILQLDGQHDRAMKALTEYLQVAERGSENYIQALQMLENLR